MQGLGFRVQGSGFRVQGSGFKVQGRSLPGTRIAPAHAFLGCRGFVFRVSCFVFRDSSLRFRV